MNKIFRLLIPSAMTACVLFAVLTTASASSLTTGYNDYHAQNYPAAVADFQAAASQTSGAAQAKAYYMEGLALHHEGKNSDAVTAYNQAQTADPSLSFASSAQDFTHNQQIAQRDSGKASTAAYVPTGQSSTAPTTDQAAYTLTTADVYVAPNFPGSVDKVKLASAAADQDCPVKIAVLNSLPPGISSPTVYAKQLSDYLHAHQPYAVIVVAVNGRGRGIADYSDNLKTAQEKTIAEKYVSQIGTGDYNTAIPAMAAEVRQTTLTDYHMPMTILSDVVFAVIIIVGIYLIVASSRKKATVTALKSGQQAQIQSVVDGISHLDEYIDVLPKNNADTDQVKAYRQAAAYKLDQAEKILARSTEVSDINRAQSILQQASMDVKDGTLYLNHLTGGASTAAEPVKPTPFPSSQAQVAQVPQEQRGASSFSSQPAPVSQAQAAQVPQEQRGVSSFSSQPAPVSQAQAAQVPHEQRGVSFFSSQPAPVSHLTPISLNVDGQQKTVMATPEEAAMVQRGQIPPVRSFNVGGQNVPWYAYQNYDPYNDYWSYQNNGWRGVAGGAMAGFIGAELLDSLFSPRPYWGGGWNSPYAYGPGWDTWGGWDNYGYGGMGGYGGSGYDQGYIQGENQARAQDYALNDQYTNPPQDNNYAGASFMGNNPGNSPGYDTSDYGNSGGASFMGNDHS